MGFSGKRVIVMGGSRGIGRSTALGFAAAGAAVSICARGHGALDATQAEIAALGVPAHAASVDLADPDVSPATCRRRWQRWAVWMCWSTTPRASGTRMTKPAGRRR